MHPLWIADAASFASGFRSFAQTAAPAAVTALWQGILVAAALVLGLRLAPRISAAHRFVMLGIGYAALTGLQILPFIAHLISSASAVASTAVSSSPHLWLELDARWSLGLAGLWIVLATVRAGDLWVHSIRLRRLWKSAVPVADDCAASLAEPLPAEPGRKRVQVCTTRELDRPSVIGFFAPRILIPDWLYARLTPGELEQVVLHESEHLRRRDDWTNLAQKLCLVLFPLNPALVWMERRLCREREMACDEGVVRMTQAPRAYAACLASLAERRLQRRNEALSLGAFEQRPELAHRVHSILLKKNVLNPIGARALLGVAGCGLLFASIGLANCPQLVTFVPAHPVPQMADADRPTDEPADRSPNQSPDQSVDLPAPGYIFAQNTRALRATSVKAVLSANSQRPAFQPNTAAVLKAQTKLRTKSADLASARPSQQLLKAEMAKLKGSAAQEPQEWVVMTTWQVQSPARETGKTADYETDAKGIGTTNGMNAQPQQPASQITVTRLILKVYPANPVAASTEGKQAPDSKSDSSSKSVLSPSAVLPFENGWLVIQL